MYKINNAGGNAKDKQFPNPSAKKGKKEEESSSDVKQMKNKYPDYKPKPKDDGGSKVGKKKDPKKPLSPAAKRLKRTASRPK
jgi:hypothetical protein